MMPSVPTGSVVSGFKCPRCASSDVRWSNDVKPDPLASNRSPVTCPVCRWTGWIERDPVDPDHDHHDDEYDHSRAKEDARNAAAGLVDGSSPGPALEAAALAERAREIGVTVADDVDDGPAGAARVDVTALANVVASLADVVHATASASPAAPTLATMVEAAAPGEVAALVSAVPAGPAEPVSAGSDVRTRAIEAVATTLYGGTGHPAHLNAAASAVDALTANRTLLADLAADVADAPGPDVIPTTLSVATALTLLRVIDDTIAVTPVSPDRRRYRDARDELAAVVDAHRGTLEPAAVDGSDGGVWAPGGADVPVGGDQWVAPNDPDAPTPPPSAAPVDTP